MPKLLEFEGPRGPILVQAPASGDEIEPVGRGREVISKVGESIGQVLGLVGDMATGFAEALEGAPVESATLEFSVQFTGKGTIYVVEAETQGAAKVTLTVNRG